MHFAKPRTLVALALAWAVFLLGYDQHASPRPLATYWGDFTGGSTRPTVVSAGDTPRLRLSLPHFCVACAAEIQARLQPLTWLGPARFDVERPENAERTGDPTDARALDLEILDLAQADFVALIEALRDAGSVPDRVEVSGIGHFRLQVELPRCYTECARPDDDQLDRLLRKETQGRWLDSVSTNPVERTVLVYARLNAVVDVVELTRALERAGIAASAIRILTGPEL